MTEGDNEPRLKDHREVSGDDTGWFRQMLASHNEGVTNPATFIGSIRAYHAHACAVIIGTVVCAAYVPQATAWHAPLRAASLRMTEISYHVPGSSPPLYTVGPDDYYFIFFYSIVLTLARWMTNELVFEALAELGGVKADKRGRFKDQGWQGLYYMAAWGVGFTLMRGTAWGQAAFAGDTDPIFQDYPVGHTEITAAFKMYYLLQLCFWVHQLFVLAIEEWRTDMPMYLFHHCLTIFLVGSSYAMNCTRIGTAILVEQDFADIFLPIALMLKYLEMETLCECFFGLFAVAWIPTRHGVFFVLYAAVWNIMDPKLNIAPYDPANGAYLGEGTRQIFLVVLGVFQCLLCMWLKELLWSIYNALFGDEESKKSKKKV